ncbi:Fc.00g103130.m01.CDS01 [Cosmosporella sp. VM-42]
MASLRQKANLPKSVAASSLSFTNKKRRETTPAKAMPAARLPQLQKSATTSALGALPLDYQIRSSSPINGMIGSKGQPLKSPGSWATKKEESPLKDKIGLFESLDREERNKKMASTKAKSLSQERQSFRNYKRKLSRAGKSLQMKGTLHRLSTSWRKRSSEETMSNPEPSAPDENKTYDAWWVKRDKAMAKKAFATQHSSNRAEFGSSFASGTDQQGSPNHYSAPIETEMLVRGKPGLSINTSLNGRRYNVDGEGGSQTSIPKPSQLPKIAHPSFYLKGSCRIRQSAVSEDLGARRSSSSNTIEDIKQVGATTWARRRVSRSFGPLVASSSCTIEEPRPIRTNELRRLVSLCKERVAQRMSSGQRRCE